MNEISLTAMNKHMIVNIKALLNFWVKIYKHDETEYEKCADGLETVHAMLLSSKDDFRTPRKAAWYCYDKVAKELQFMPRNDIERPGHDAAKGIFEKRLRGSQNEKSRRNQGS